MIWSVDFPRGLCINSISPKEGKKNGPVALLAKAKQRRPTTPLLQGGRGQCVCHSTSIKIIQLIPEKDMGRHGSLMGGLHANFFKNLAMQNATFSLTFIVHAAAFMARVTYLEQSIINKPCPRNWPCKREAMAALNLKAAL